MSADIDAKHFSKLQLDRLRHRVPLPAVLAAPGQKLTAGAVMKPAQDAEKIASLFPATFGRPTVAVEAEATAPARASPLKVGVVLSGGQAAGGHSVIAGLFDGLRKAHPDSVLYGFLNGPRGLFTESYTIIDDALMDRYRSLGGFDIIGSGRDKIESAEQFAGCRTAAERLDLDGVVIIGGDDSNTNAAVLAEYFAAQGVKTKVVGCPKTIDGDLKVPEAGLDISFGCVTARWCRL
jgi:diphosphate--fructose-6-phosphate 1-phosphotransferase